MNSTRAGRPRSDDAGPALLTAARKLVIEHGYQAVSIADITQAAGTGRQTLYRRWPGKAELVLDAFTDDASARVDGTAQPDLPSQANDAPQLDDVTNPHNASHPDDATQADDAGNPANARKTDNPTDVVGETSADGGGEPSNLVPPPSPPVQEFLVRTFRALDESGPALRSLMAEAQRDTEFHRLFLERFIKPRRLALRAVIEGAQAAGTLRSSLDVETAISTVYGALWYRLLLGEPLDDAYAAALVRLLDGDRPSLTSSLR